MKNLFGLYLQLCFDKSFNICLNKFFVEGHKKWSVADDAFFPAGLLVGFAYLLVLAAVLAQYSNMQKVWCAAG